MSNGGGGGNNGETKYVWNDDMAPYWRNALASAQIQANQPYQAYTGQRVAGLDTLQNQASNNLQHYVNDPQDFLYGQGNQATQDTLAGNHLSGEGSNTLAQTANSYAGMNNQFFNDTLNRGADLITQKYQNATEPQLRAAAVMNGTLGGGDYQNQVKNAQTALGQELGNYASGMQNDQYNRSAQLTDNYLNRGSQAWDSERNRQMQAMQLAQNDQNLTLQRYDALNAAGAQNRGYQQQVDDQGYQDWFNQQNYGKNNLAWLTSVLGSAQGGLPASQMTYSPSNSVANGLGGALAAYGLFRQ
jgi:hypothetical protein